MMNEKRITKDMLIQAYSNGYRTLQDIGLEFGVTRERIRQLRKKYGLQELGRREHKKHLCKKCGTELPWLSQRSSWRCEPCKRVQYIHLVCGECNQPFSLTMHFYRVRMRKVVKSRIGPRVTPLFCSKSCYGRWFGKRKGGQGKKLQSEECTKIINMFLEKKSRFAIAKELSRSYTTVWKVIERYRKEEANLNKGNEGNLP